jgi:hypothetical protein
VGEGQTVYIQRILRLRAPPLSVMLIISGVTEKEDVFSTFGTQDYSETVLSLPSSLVHFTVVISDHL